MVGLKSPEPAENLSEPTRLVVFGSVRLLCSCIQKKRTNQTGSDALAKSTSPAPHSVFISHR
jgi:hypothetical protein